MVLLPILTALLILAALATTTLGARPAADDGGAAAVAWRTSAPDAARARARHLDAMFRARAAGSADGVRRACDGFAALGDTDVVRACRRVAESLK